MECKAAQQLFPYYLRGTRELEPQELEALEAHLGECGACSAQIQSEMKLDAELGSAIRAVRVPEGLRERIMSRLQLRRGAVVRRWVGLATALVAACLLIAVGAYLVSTSRGVALPPIDVNDLSGSLSQARTPDQIQEWLDYRAPGSLWLPGKLRDEWNFNLLDHYYVQYVDGHAVPTLVFRKDHHRAKVYLFQQGQYEPSSVAEEYRAQEPQTPWKLGGDGVGEYTAVVVGERGDWRTFSQPGR
jgi:hypothetical protein